MINTILQQLNEEYQFNSGGCCYVAYLIARELERLGEPFRLVIMSNSWRGNHYAIRSPRFGSLNVHFTDYSDVVEFKASSETIKRIYDENDWSLKYDTVNNKALEKEIKTIFSIY